MKTNASIVSLAVSVTALAFLAMPAAQAVPAGFPVTDGLSLYLEADAAELDGPHVVRLHDLSGKGNDAVEKGRPAPTRPLLVPAATPAGLDAIHFDGLGGYLEVPPNSPLFDGRARTTLVVFRPNALGVGRIINSAFTSLNPDNPDAPAHHSVHSMFANTGGVLRIQNRTASGSARAVSTQNGSVAVGNFYIGANVWVDDGLSVVSVRDQNNQRFVSQTDGADATPTGHLWTRIGAHAGTGNPEPIDFFNGDVSAVLVYNRALDPWELEQMEEQLRRIYLTGETAPAEAAAPAVSNGLVLHLNAANVQTEGSVVSLALDLSGHGNHASSFVAGEIPPRPAPLQSPSTTPSGRSAIFFDGWSHYLEVSANPADFDGAGKTTLVVFRAHTLGVGRMVNSAYSTLNPGDPAAAPHYSVHSMFARTGGDLRIQNRNLTGGSVALSTESGIVNTDDFFIGGSIWIPTGEQVALLRTTGGERYVSAADGANANPAGHIWTWVGANSTPGAPDPIEHFHGEMAAVVVFNRPISPEELLEVEEFLHSRYLQSPDGHSFAGWIAGYGLPAGQQGTEDNPAGDGIVNLVKYALGLDPTRAGREGLPEIVLQEVNGEFHLEVLVGKNPDAADVAYLPEVSTDLVQWYSGEEYIEVLEDDDLILRARDRSPLGEMGRRFIRVNVSLIDD